MSTGYMKSTYLTQPFQNPPKKAIFFFSGRKKNRPVHHANPSCRTRSVIHRWGGGRREQRILFVSSVLSSTAFHGDLHSIDDPALYHHPGACIVMGVGGGGFPPLTPI